MGSKDGVTLYFHDSHLVDWVNEQVHGILKGFILGILAMRYWL